MADSNLTKMIETALENIRKMTDVNTVIGEPVKVSNGITVIPVSKVSVGFVSGGMDYNSKAAPEKAPNFGGGTGSGFSINPIGFLVVDENGGVSLLNMNAPAASEGKDIIGTISGLVDKAPSMVEKIKQIFNKDKDKAKETAQENPENTGDSGNAVVLDNAVAENLETSGEKTE